jgi:hypothetical protein
MLHWKNGIMVAVVSALVTISAVGGFGWSWH